MCYRQPIPMHLKVSWPAKYQHFKFRCSIFRGDFNRTLFVIWYVLTRPVKRVALKLTLKQKYSKTWYFVLEESEIWHITHLPEFVYLTIVYHLIEKCQYGSHHAPAFATPSEGNKNRIFFGSEKRKLFKTGKAKAIKFYFENFWMHITEEWISLFPDWCWLINGLPRVKLIRQAKKTGFECENYFNEMFAFKISNSKRKKKQTIFQKCPKIPNHPNKLNRHFSVTNRRSCHETIMVIAVNFMMLMNIECICIKSCMCMRLQ